MPRVLDRVYHANNLIFCQNNLPVFFLRIFFSTRIFKNMWAKVVYEHRVIDGIESYRCLFRKNSILYRRIKLKKSSEQFRI